MPNYDYTCEKCGHQMVAFQSIKAEPLTKCPSCNQEGLKRGVGGGNTLFQFKGEGFYITDYKDDSKKKSGGGSCGCSGSHTCG